MTRYRIESMVRFPLSAPLLERVSAHLSSQASARRSNHWREFGAANRARVVNSGLKIAAGTGFDGEFELNFRPRSVGVAHLRGVGRRHEMAVGVARPEQHAALHAIEQARMAYGQ